eukprot:8622837-Pyramimonas_sp.AAC.1
MAMPYNAPPGNDRAEPYPRLAGRAAAPVGAHQTRSGAMHRPGAPLLRGWRCVASFGGAGQRPVPTPQPPQWQPPRGGDGSDTHALGVQA